MSLKNILFFLFFLSFISKGSENYNGASVSQKQKQPCVFQKSPSILGSEDYNKTGGILEALKLTEYNFTEPSCFKITRPGIQNFIRKQFVYSAGYYWSYSIRRTNNLNPSPLYITIRSLIV